MLRVSGINLNQKSPSKSIAFGMNVKLGENLDNVILHDNTIAQINDINNFAKTLSPKRENILLGLHLYSSGESYGHLNLKLDRPIRSLDIHLLGPKYQTIRLNRLIDGSEILPVEKIKEELQWMAEAFKGNKFGAYFKKIKHLIK